MDRYEKDFQELANDQELQAKCKELVDTSIARAEELFESPDFISKNGWKLETESAPLETVIYSKKAAEGKLFLLRAELPCPSEVYFNDYWCNFPDSEKWNPAISFSKAVVKMNDNCDITNYGNKDMFAVKARDFVVVRGFKKLDDGSFLTVGKSIKVPMLPEKKECVRGELILGAGRFAQKKDDPNVTVVDYLMAIDLKGLLPKVLVNTFMAKLMLNDVECSRKHAEAISKN